jgi:hypothetical protein
LQKSEKESLRHYPGFFIGTATSAEEKAGVDRPASGLSVADDIIAIILLNFTPR